MPLLTSPRVLLLSTLLCTAPLALAHPAGQTDFGHPAKAAQATRTIRVEANDQMQLRFSQRDIRQGDVVRFIVTNHGKARHEFGIADPAAQKQHAAEMRAMPDMMHDEPNVISLNPGETKSLTWSFSKLKSHDIVFACNLPGHAEAGMKQTIHIP
ncbi:MULTISPECIES: plastocyanin/azurin family copper-binding protein [unclassified Paludibacterium]|uniref:cupredoxin domain-containing protein n=1 Tax=unclassified Paludibacterium TaxID=2618429 RepID=UPI001C04C290|nr:plastocyanin/azurin family copper-binding protein [Paludibacterium sp. B53371]BEV71870.1 hypothetical protein THUN1379_13520 [Paludibacterium sp. THUN1379]